MSNKERIWNLDVNNITLEELIEGLENDVATGKTAQTIACANPHSLAVASRDLDFLEALSRSSYVIPDGIGIIWASRILGGRIRNRVTGPDLLEELSNRWSKSQFGSFMFFGSTPQTLQQLNKALFKRYPGIKITGLLSPPFGEIDEETNDAFVEAINRAKPTVLWVGMTAPKQEKWISKNRERLKVPIIAGVGAAFDFSAGTKPRPEWARRLNMDWLPRLLREPGRMWRRTFISLPIFFCNVFAQRLADGRASFQM